jgi:hypothetical protein
VEIPGTGECGDKATARNRMRKKKKCDGTLRRVFHDFVKHFRRVS